jgi:hypothetical protein
MGYRVAQSSLKIIPYSAALPHPDPDHARQKLIKQSQLCVFPSSNENESSAILMVRKNIHAKGIVARPICLPKPRGDTDGDQRSSLPLTIGAIPAILVDCGGSSSRESSNSITSVISTHFGAIDPEINLQWCVRV